MNFLIALLIATVPASAAEIAYENFINDLVDAFRKPFQEKLWQISTNNFFELNNSGTQVRFYSDDPSVCPNLVSTSDRIPVAAIRMSVSFKPTQAYQQVEYTGCDSTLPIFNEFLLITGENLSEPNLTGLYKRNLDMTLKPNETGKSYFVQYKGVRIFQITSKRTSPTEYLTRFEMTSTPIITVFTNITANHARLTLRAHSFLHQYMGSTDYYRSNINGGEYSDFVAEATGESALIKYFNSALKPISKKEFDENYNELFLESINGTVGAYFRSFISRFPRTEAIVDTRGSTMFLNNLKEAYNLILLGQTLNAQKIIELLISNIESGKTQVTERSQ